jgi:ABC-type transport system involved in cytochrome bd biosynthesis fused ATPase/permease subunit
MAERSHLTHRLRHLPDLLRQLLRSIFELLATAAGIIWLDAAAAPLVSIAVSAALVPAFSTQPLLAERDLRMRSHAAGLTRFYLDAMLGLSAIRAHGAEQNVRREHDSLLRHWTDAALRLQKAVVSTEAIQLAVMFGLVTTLLLGRPLAGAQIGRTLLLVYWALNLPTLGQDIAALARQYPYYRNLTLRLLEPLGAPEEEAAAQEERVPESHITPSIEFINVSAEASGHTILHEVNVRIKGGTHVAIVGPSGAGKSSFIGVLLGWLKPSGGSVSVDGRPLDCASLRQTAAWVDPAVQLWNHSLLSNLQYGTKAGEADIARAVDAALLRQVLENLPDGLQTKLGEGGGLVSGGEGQRVRLGRALLRKDTQLVLLDEPFRGLDREKRRDLLDRARRYWRGRTMLCVTHDIAETKTFDRVLVIEGGTVIEDGKPQELARDHTSRYAQLLAAEVQTRSGLWGASLWRRIRIHRGQALEEVPTVECEEISEIEVA